MKKGYLRLSIVAGLVAMLWGAAGVWAADDAGRLDIVPWPKSIQMQNGIARLADGGRIVAEDPKLMPLANVLSQEIAAAFGVKMEPASGGAKPGDIALQIDAALKPEQYTLDISDRAEVRGADYESVAMGTVTLLQAIKSDGGKVSLPALAIKDEPTKAYRGVMIDVAREENSIDDLKRCVLMCQMYKIRYMHLHLTDDNAWTFPSTAFPKLGSANQPLNGSLAKVYPLNELRELVKYADDRGVTLVPEMDAPGHTDALRIPYPQIFDSNDGPAHMGVVDVTNPKALDGLATLVGEMCDVFKSSPYFHIGADEVNQERWKISPTYKSFLSEHGFKGPNDLYCYYIQEMDKIVKKNGRQTLVWGDFNPNATGKDAIPKDIIAVAWRDETDINSYLKKDYPVINGTWTPLYVVAQTPERMKTVEDARNKHRPETIYKWSVDEFNKTTVPPNNLILGAQICAWEQGGPIQVPSLRTRVSAMGERVWNPDAGKSFDDFNERYQGTAPLLDKLLATVKP